METGISRPARENRGKSASPWCDDVALEVCVRTAGKVTESTARLFGAKGAIQTFSEKKQLTSIQCYVTTYADSADTPAKKTTKFS